MKKIVILISGRGSNLQAILSARLPVTVAAVISNEPAAGGLAIAKQHGVATRVVDHNAYADRAAFDAALAKEIDALKPDLVALAGFMRILTDDFVRHFAGRLINIHPSLLPAFTGLHTHRRALEAGVKVHGCTVHFVTPQLDHGPIVIQAAVPVLPGDSEDALATRVLEQEHRIYPQSIRWFCEDRLEITPRGTVKLKPARDTSGTPASREQGPAERGAGTRLRDATANPAVSASVIPAPCASPGSDPKGNPLPPCDAPRLRDAIGRESGAALSSAGVASVSGVTSPEGDPVPPSDGAPASREQGSRLRDATGRESGAALSSAGVASVSGVTSPKGAPVPTSGGAPASREQGSRLRDASGRESGAAPSSAGVASVSGVTSPKGAPVPTSGGALPLFIGPPESAKVMAIQYGYFQRSLAAIGQVPVQVQVSPRRAWQVRLDSGLVIELGRDSIESRLDRFTAVYDRTVNRLQRKLDYVDLRYPNGFAVRIPELRHDPREKRRGGKTARATG